MDDDKDGSEDADQVKAGADGEADACHGPDSCGGGEALGIIVAVAVDDAGAEETDAADHLGRDPGRIPAFDAGEEDVKFPHTVPSGTTDIKDEYPSASLISAGSMPDSLWACSLTAI